MSTCSDTQLCWLTVLIQLKVCSRGLSNLPSPATHISGTHTLHGVAYTVVKPRHCFQRRLRLPSGPVPVLRLARQNVTTVEQSKHSNTYLAPAWCSARARALQRRTCKSTTRSTHDTVLTGLLVRAVPARTKQHEL